MFRNLIVSAVAAAIAFQATAALADGATWGGAKTGGISLQQKAPRSNGLHVRFADQVQRGGAPKASARTTRLGSTNYAKYGRVAPNENARFGTTSHVTKKSKAPGFAPAKQAKHVQFDRKGNRVYKIEKSGKSNPVTHGAPRSGGLKAGMTTKEARALNARKKAASPKYKAYKANQHTLAKTRSGGLRVKKGQVVPPKNARFGATSHVAKIKSGSLRVKNGKVLPPKHARFGTTSHVAKGAKTAKRGTKAAKAARTGAKVAKTGRKLRTIGKFAAGGAATAVAGAALGVKVPDAVDAAMFTGKLITDPKNAPKRLAGAAKGGVRMIGTAADAITDPSRMARNLYGAANGVGRSVANTKVYKRLAKTRTGRQIGKATSWTKKRIGTSYNKFKRTKTAKAIGSTARTVDKKVFKPLNRSVNKGMKAAGKGAKKIAGGAKKASKKVSKKVAKGAKKIAKGAKKIGKKLKFW